MRVSVFVFAIVLGGCASDEEAAVCGEGQWEGFACDFEVEAVTDASNAAYNEAYAATTQAEEAAAQLDAMEDQVDALDVVERTLHPMDIPTTNPYTPDDHFVWDSIDMDDVHDVHVLWEVREASRGDAIPHPDNPETRCELTTDGELQIEAWSDEWTETFYITPDGHPEVILPDMRWVSSTCGEEISPGQYMAPIAPFGTVTLVVDWNPA